MDDIKKDLRRMAFNHNTDTGHVWFGVRGSYRSSENSNRSGGIWRLSWIARRTWISIFSKGAGRKRSRARAHIAEETACGERQKIKVPVAINLFVVAYVSIFILSLVFTISALAK